MPTMPAILGNARLANFRLGYVPAALTPVRTTRVTILLDGAPGRVRRDGLVIRDLLNEAPNTCSLVVDGLTGPAPVSGQRLRITINSDVPRVLFAGALQTDDLTYAGRPANLEYPCSAIDDTARLNRRRPFGTWTNISATTIAQYLVATFAPGFSAAGIEAALPLVTITFDGSTTLMGCLAQLASLIGGYCFADDNVAFLFLTNATDLPDDVDVAHPPQNDPPIRLSSDDSQLRTRVYGKGHAEPTMADVVAGATILPVADAVMYNPAGGRVIASTTPDGAPSQILTYTGVQLGGGGDLVGTGAMPTAQPALATNLGSGVTVGVHLYAVTFVTAAGETLASAPVAITVGPVVPTPTLTRLASGASPPLENGAWLVKVSWLYADGTESPASTASNSVTMTGPNDGLRVSLPIGPSSVIGRRVYFKQPSSALYRAWGPSSAGGPSIIANNTATTADYGANIFDPVLEPAQRDQVVVSEIPIGNGLVTSRRVWRTAAGGSQLKLLTTIADNLTQTFIDTVADGSLGANVPTLDTSGLAQPDGVVAAGSTTIPVASTTAFAAGGGWALAGQQLIHYTGTSGAGLTGVPASGDGSLEAEIAFNTTVMPAPALTGVTGITLAVAKGSPVHLWVQRDDLVAQAAAAARESTADYTSDGIHEHVITDERRGEASLIALCDADLIRFAMPIQTATYDCRDVKTKSGKPVVIDLPSLPISATLTIQEVTITEIDQSPGTPPRFSVTASSVRFSLEDILRRLAAS
jgi:hypothetical protein